MPVEVRNLHARDWNRPARQNIYITRTTRGFRHHTRRARDDGNGIVIENTYAELHVNDRGDRATHVSNHADRAERVNYT